MGDAADDAMAAWYDELFNRQLRGAIVRMRRPTAAQDFNQPVETTTMNIREIAEAQLRRNEAERQRLLTRLDLIDSFGEEDPWEDQTVISFDRNFGGPRTYTHVAVRLGGKWWVTGNRNVGTSFTWEQLVEEHLAKCLPGTLYVATEWTAYEEM